MRLMRLGEAGKEKPAVIDEGGVARDVSGIVGDFTPETMPVLTERLAGVDLASLPELDAKAMRVGAPIARPRTIWCIGLNYSDHAAEAGMPIPDEPILFVKPGSALAGPSDPIPLPRDSRKLDWEIELGVVISRPALNVAKDAALSHVLGYTVVNDLSEREWQIERGGQWSKGKSYPGFCPTGPLLVTADEVGDPQDLSMQLSVNGETMQSGSTNTMIFDVATIISYLSKFCLLEAGDLICTGTPPGVGMGMSPQRFLQDGDALDLEITGLGRQSATVRRVT